MFSLFFLKLEIGEAFLINLDVHCWIFGLRVRLYSATCKLWIEVRYVRVWRQNWHKRSLNIFRLDPSPVNLFKKRMLFHLCRSLTPQSLLRVLLQETIKKSFHFVTYFGHFEPFVLYVIEKTHSVLVFEGRIPCHHFINNASQTPPVNRQPMAFVL